MKYNLIKIGGSSENFKLEHRILNYTLIIGAFLNILSGFGNFSLGLTKITYVFPAISFFIFLLIYIFSLVSKNYKIASVLGLTYLIFIYFPVMWFILGGYQGGITPYIPLFIITIIFSQNKFSTWIFSISMIIILASLFFYELYYPLYLSYQSRSDQYTDLLINYLLSFISIFVIIYLFNKTIIESRKQIEELNKFKEDTFSMIAHDLKNPLNTIINISDNENVLLAGNKMLNLVLNILEIRKFETHKFDLNISEKSLNSLVNEALLSVKYLLAEKNIVVEKHYNLKYTLYVEPLLIVRVFENLLINAIKHSTLNSIIDIYATEVQDNKIKIDICDSGSGFSKEAIDNLFKPFSSYSTSESNIPIPASGLGLAFCKFAIEAHSGKIFLDTEIKKKCGATMSFILPGSINSELYESVLLNCENDNIEYSEEDIATIKYIKSELDGIELYELSTITGILDQIKINVTSKNLSNWITNIENAVYASNKELYHELLKIVD